MFLGMGRIQSTTEDIRLDVQTSGHSINHCHIGSVPVSITYWLEIVGSRGGKVSPVHLKDTTSVLQAPGFQVFFHME